MLQPVFQTAAPAQVAGQAAGATPSSNPLVRTNPFFKPPQPLPANAMPFAKELNSKFTLGNVNTAGDFIGQGGPSQRQLQHQLMYMMNPSAMAGIRFLSEMQPGQQARTAQALAALAPGNRQGRVNMFRQNAMGQANDVLQQQMGAFSNLNPQLLDAMRLGLINQAQQAGNEFMMQQYDPMRDVEMAQAGAELLDPAIAAPLLNQYMGTVFQQMQPRPRRGGLTLGGVLGAAAQLAGMAGSLGWSPFKKATGGAKKTP